MSDLFTIPESKSPRLLWMERHNVNVIREDKYLCCYFAHGNKEGSGFGATEDEAITQYALSAGIKLWNEE